MGEHVRIQKTFPGEGKGSKGYLCFQGVVWGIFSVNLINLGFFRPLPDSPLKISAWESNFKCKPK